MTTTALGQLAGKQQDLARRFAVEFARLGALAAEAAQCFRELEQEAEELAARVSGIDSEIRALGEIVARGLRPRAVLDMTQIESLTARRAQLALEVPVRRRAAALARERLDAANGELNAARAAHVTAAQSLTAGRRVIRVDDHSL
ncbi:MAG TPA: hypothetical protein VN848_13745 [Gemmatimonadales bacterium]|nr:hypothetical protein [Gemmatimonadales bacterium]